MGSCGDLGCNKELNSYSCDRPSISFFGGLPLVDRDLLEDKVVQGQSLQAHCLEFIQANLGDVQATEATDIFLFFLFRARVCVGGGGLKRVQHEAIVHVRTWPMIFFMLHIFFRCYRFAVVLLGVATVCFCPPALEFDVFVVVLQGTPKGKPKFAFGFP